MSHCLQAGLILGISGACRREELHDLKIDDITDKGSLFLINIPKSKNYTSRSFTVMGEFYQILLKYLSLRPENADSRNFFLKYQNGRCTKQVIGINTFGNMPKEIAKYLDLPNSNEYTGHTFRRSSATLLADSGANLTTVKRHGGWKSSSVAEGYIDESINNKKEVSNSITKNINVKSDVSKKSHSNNVITFDFPEYSNIDHCESSSTNLRETDEINTSISSANVNNLTNLEEISQNFSKQGAVLNLNSCSHFTVNIFKNL